MAAKIKHPMKNQTFQLLQDGTVLVEDLDTSSSGIFQRNGKRVSGELKFADPHFLDWIAGRPGGA